MIKYEQHYNQFAWVNSRMDKMRKEECLCLNCGRNVDCSLSKNLFDICKQNHIALAVTRCPIFRLKDLVYMIDEKGVNK